MKRNKVRVEEIQSQKSRLVFDPAAQPGTMAEIYINDRREDVVVNDDGISVDLDHPMSDDDRVDIYVQ